MEKRLSRDPVATTLTLPAEGITCASCVARVEKVLRKVDGVRSASVNRMNAAAAMGFSSLRVVSTSLRLKRFTPYVSHEFPSSYR